MSILFNKTSSDEKLEEAFPPSNMLYEQKVKALHNLRARVINNDAALQGLLTFVPSNVVPDGHEMFDSVAYTDGDEMYFADRFFALSQPFQCACILHEMFHIVFRHVTRGRKRIHSLYNICADAIINESIGFEEDIKSTNSFYAYFPKEHVVSLDSIYKEYGSPTAEDIKKGCHGSQWTSESLYEFVLKRIKEKLEKQVQEEEKQNKNKNKKKGKSSLKNTNLNNSSTNINSASNKNSNESELDKIEREVRDLLDRLAKKHKMIDGNDIKPGESGKDETSNQIDDFKWTQRFNRSKAMSSQARNSILGKINPDVYKAQIPWNVELRKYLVKSCMPTTEITLSKPARRMSSLRRCNTYLPGIQNKKGLDKMVVIVDTSGSCFNEEELSMFCTEIQSIQTSTGVQLNLIFADTEVQSEITVTNDGLSLLEKMKRGIVKAAGGGGTDMTVPFLYALKKYKPILTVIASDGYTPFPKPQDVKKTNLIWVINTNENIPKGCGKALYIKQK